jgi:Kef-type K+ transport system membrane component KefB
VNGSDAAALILIAIGAFVLPLIAVRIGVPAVVLEIVFGISIGPWLGLVHGNDLIGSLASLGFLLLLFLAGFEIDFGVFERQGAGPVVTGLAVFGGTLAASWVAAQLLGLGVFMMLVLSTTSVGLVVPTLRSSRQITTPLGQQILVSALLADFLTLLAVTVGALVVESGVGPRLLALPAFLVIAAFLLLALRRAAWWVPERFERLFDADDPDEVGIRAALALMLVAVGVALVLGIEPILGAFLAGTAFAAVFRNRGDLDRKLTGFGYGFLIPVFFINVGISFELAGVADLAALGFTGLLLLAAVAVKVIPALLLVVRRYTLREAVAAGALLSARLSLIIVVAELGVQLELLTRTLQAQIILLAVATATLSPAIFRWVLPGVSRNGGASAGQRQPLAARGRAGAG